MFLEHFVLNEQPFGVSPDSRFFYLGSKHRAAMNALISGTEPDRGVLMLTAEPGMGKTSLLFHYLQTLRDDPRTGFLFQTAGDSLDLTRYLLADLGLQDSRESVEVNAILNRSLSARVQAGYRFLLVIDDAHKLRIRATQSQLCSEFSQPWMKLIQIVVAGRPELAEILAEPSMACFRERIGSSIRLTGFSAEETSAYMERRLRAAGYMGPRLFTPDAQLLIAMHSRGVPRNINALCFNSMWIAYTMGEKQVNSTIVREAVDEIVVGSRNSEEVSPEPVCVTNRIFAPLRPETNADTNAKPGRSPMWILACTAIFICALLSLVVVSGAYRRTGTFFPPIGGQPTADTTVAPASTPSLAPAPVTMTKLAPVSDAPEVQPIAVTDNAEIPIALTRSNARPRRATVTVIVEPHVTLRHLCLQYVGRFDSKTVAEVRKLNPSLTDPNQIEVNQKIQLPIYPRQTHANETNAVADSLEPASERKP